MVSTELENTQTYIVRSYLRKIIKKDPRFNPFHPSPKRVTQVDVVVHTLRRQKQISVSSRPVMLHSETLSLIIVKAISNVLLPCGSFSVSLGAILEIPSYAGTGVTDQGPRSL